MPFTELEHSAGNPPPGDSDTAYVKVDSADGFLKFRTDTAERQVVTTDQTQTLTNKTLTAPSITSGAAVTSFTITGASSGDAGIILDADNSDDNADKWTIQSTASDNELDFINHTTSVAQLTTAGALTLAAGITATGGVLTTPSIVAPSGTASTGMMITKSGVLTELNGDGTYAITIAVPAGAFIHRIMVSPQALWTAGTSAALIVGDTADPDGYFVSTDLKATDLVVGEVFDTISSSSWGGKEGAYLVAATGRRGPTSSNFGTYYAAGSNIIFSATKVGSGTAGRTAVSVTYSVGETIAQVVT